jgi:hypothetical protein
MEQKVLYQDNLIVFFEDSLILKNYYFPFLSGKRVIYSQIEKLEIRKPSLSTGKWRIWGSGDFKTWFPMDTRRNTRNRIFIMYLNKKYWRIGFTVESPEKVIEILELKVHIDGID